MDDVKRPDWWCYPVACRRGHPWGPGLVSVSWTPCGCAGGDGHLRVHCREPGCRETWYQPPHEPGAEVIGYPPPVRGSGESAG